MARILRGEIRWADLDPTRRSEQAGKRPVVVISESVFNENSGTVIAMALTSQEPRAGFPLTLELKSVRLPKRSWVKISQIRVLSVQRLGAKLRQVSDEELAELIEGLNEILGHS
jgi:mRNA interferase MazF